MDSRSRDFRRVLIIPPASAGSLGDQAMVDALAAQYKKSYGSKIFLYPDCFELRSKYTCLNSAIFPQRITATLSKLIAATAPTEINLLGADNIDGRYGAGKALARLKFLQFAHRMGKPVRVLGCSWSEAPAPSVRDAMRQADWLTIYARDPLSRDRMERDFQRAVPLVADLAFLLEPGMTTESAKMIFDFITENKREDSTMIGVNISKAAIDRHQAKNIEPFERFLTQWITAAPSRYIVFIPHDSRPGVNDDFEVAHALVQTLQSCAPGRVIAPEGPWNAWDAKAIVAELDLVLTSRMHLAIACLSMGTPPACLPYANKFEGLLSYFELGELSLDGERIGNDPAIAEKFDFLIANKGEMGAKILRNIDEIKKLSLKNIC